MKNCVFPVDAKRSALPGSLGRAISVFAKSFALLLLFAGLLLGATNANAVACNSLATGSWGTAGTWSCGHVPLAADDVTIVATHIITMNGNSGVAQSLVVNGTATWTLARTTNVGVGGVIINAGGNITGAANGVLTSTGGLTINATLTSTTVTITLQTTAAQTISGTGSLARLTVTGAGVTATNTGTLTVGTALAGTGGLTNSAAGVLNIGGTSAITTLTATAVGNTVNYTGAAQTVKATTYYNLGIAGAGTKTVGAITLVVNGTTMVSSTLAITSATGTKTFTGDVIINNGGTWSETAAEAISFGGNLQNDGTLTASTGVHTFSGAAKTFSGANAIVIPSVAVTGTYANNGTLTVATALSGAGGLTNGAAGVLNIGGSSGITTLTATAVGNTVNYTGGAAQTINATTYDILTASGAGAKTISAATTVNATMTVTGTVTNNSTLTVTGALSGAGALTNSASGVLNIAGSSGITTLTAAAVGNAVNYTGGAAQTIKVTTYHHLGISGGDKTLGGDTTVNGVLTLTSGTITTGANTLTLAASCPGSYSRTSGYVIGNLRLAFPGGNNTCVYHVGDSIGYAPITVAILGAAAGTLTGRADAGDHPDTVSSSSGIDAAKSANHYWTLTSGTLSTYTSYSATFQYCANSGSCTASEVDTGANTGNFIVARKISGTWSTPTVGTKTSYSTQATGITSANGFGEFAVGEVNLCFADSFAGVLGSNWSVGSQSGSFTPAIVSSRLRVTDSTTGQATWATLQRLFPAAGNKVTVEFDHFSYGGTGGDGMAVVFSDASVSSVAGAFGGSLGYAQKSNPGSDCTVVGGCPGFTGGWLGIALDEYGNFSNPTEGRYGGTGQVADSVAIRGSGTGVSGYRFLQGTTTLSPGIDGNNVPPGTVAHRYRIIIDHTDSVHANVSVERDTTSGAGMAYTTLIAPFDVKDPGYSQSNIPTSFNLSFTGSTGASTNYHEIGNLRVCTVQGLAAPTLHHVEIDHNGSACTSGTAPVTVKACANAGCTALYGGSVTVDLTPNAGGALTWAPTEPVTFSGGSVAMTLANTTAGTVTLGGTATSPTTGNVTQCFNGATQTCSLVFSACTVDAVEVSATSAAGQPIFTKLANTAFNLHAVRTGGGNQNVSAVELVDASSGTCSTYPALTSTISPTTFTISNANPRQTVTFTYNNAAPNVRVRMTTTGPVLSCSSDNFAIRPQAFIVTSSATQSGNSGAPVFRAGRDPFSLTATAVYGATPTSGYAGSPRLNASLVFSAQASTGTMTNVAFPAASSGASTASGFTYDEVGNIYVGQPNPSKPYYGQPAVYDDTFAQVDSVKGECIPGFSNVLDGNGKYSCQFGSSLAGAFGRFVPDHFTVMGTVSNACAAGAFTYMGQPFTLSPAGVVQARNFANVVTQNYVAAYAPGSVSFGAEDADNGIDLGASVVFFPSGVLGGAWTSGVYTLNGENTSVTFVRPVANPSGPFDALDIGLKVDDADVATSPLVAGADMNPTTVGNNTLTYKKFSGGPLTMRYGRLRLLNAYGSELLPLTLPVRAEYWTGQGFALNALDTCTNFAKTAVKLTSSTTITTEVDATGGATITLGSGLAGIPFTKPTSALPENVDVCMDLGPDPTAGVACATSSSAAMPWLQGRWPPGTNYDNDPKAKATFGVYRSLRKLIHRREVF